MKKAFEQNVSRSRPRVKLGSLLEESPGQEEEAAPPAAKAPPPPEPAAAVEVEAPVRAPPVAARAPAAPLAETESTRPAAPGHGRRGAEAVAEMLARHAA